MNTFELSRNFFNWCFDNPEKVKPIHPAIYFFAIEHCNRLGWKEKFGFPSQMVMEAIGVKNWRTYSKGLDDLIEWGFIKSIEKSKNQYSSNIIAIVYFTKANTKALDKALQKHSTKQSQSTVSINKQETINNKQETIYNNKGAKVFSPDILECYYSILEHFPCDLHPTNENQKESWIDCIDKLKRIDNLGYSDIIQLVKITRGDDFWSKNFLSLVKLRKKNKDGIAYWKVFYNNFKNNKNTNNYEQFTDLQRKGY
jgi:hypothetical protein